MEKLLPQNIEAECGVLGSIIIDPEAIRQVADFLQAEDFYRTAHKRIYEVLIAFEQVGDPADYITLCDELEHRGTLTDVGGAAYISELINGVPTSGNVEFYARIVERMATLRRLIHAASRIAAVAYEDGVTVEDALQQSQHLIDEVRAKHTTSSLIDHRLGLATEFEALSSISEQRERGIIITGVETGLPTLDRMTGGLARGDLIVAAARTSVGKSSLALNIARHAIGEGKTVLFFSLEMPPRQLWQRLIADETGIDQARLRIGWIQQDGLFQRGARTYDGEWPLLVEGLESLHDVPGTLWVDASTSTSPLYMRQVAHKLQAEHGLDLIIVDYLQLMEADSDRHGTRFENRVQVVSALSKGLKQTARALDVPLLALAQLNREAEGVEPQLSHLRESGSIEADSDMVWLLWLTEENCKKRDAQPEEDESEEKKPEEEKPKPEYDVEFKVAKQRNGPVGKVPLHFVPYVTRFVER